MKTVDDFEWDKYNEEHYMKELSDANKRGEVFLVKDSYVDGDEIVFKENLHEARVWSLQHIHRVKPKRVLEIGCAGGHNLFNIKALFPDIEVFGIERDQNQFDNVSKHFDIPDSIKNNVIVGDAVDAKTFEGFSDIDFVYTIAVIMHMTYEKAVATLRNMAFMDASNMRITEDMGQHDYQKLFDESGISEKYDIKTIGYTCEMAKKKNKD